MSPRPPNRTRTPAQQARRKLLAEQRRRKVRGVRPSRLISAQSALQDDDGFDVPDFTPAVARTFALLLAAGVPKAKIPYYLLPDCDEALRHRTFDAWCASPRLLDAVNALNGGEWHLLDKDRRLQLAEDKVLAEMAYYLVEHRFDDATEAKTVARMRECREAIRQKLAGASGDTGDALDTFMRTLAKMVEGASGFGKAPQLYEVSVGTSIPVEAVKGDES